MFREPTEEEKARIEEFENMPVSNLTVRQLKEIITQIVDSAPIRARERALSQEELLCKLYPDRPRQLF